MRILYDSKKLCHKDPFGCLLPGQACTLQIHIPATVGTTAVQCVFQRENGEPYREEALQFSHKEGPYDIWKGCFRLEETGLFFYYFRITGCTGTFRLFKQDEDTNMEAGDLWQVSSVPAEHAVPDWAKGAVIYQVFPDRFCKHGECDLTGKLEPYTVHESWKEEVDWRPNEKGQILNNDFFGGNFRGITQKLPYIASLGTTILYLNPISKSFSSHRYDTGDYMTPDPMLGTAEDFRAMCEEAHRLGIRVVLDGVYSHTGSNSLYFDREGAFGGAGAYSSPDSPYRDWFTFTRYPTEYKSWWGFDTLPTVNKLHPGFMDHIFRTEDSVMAYWLRQGADGFRLDVADELPNEFLKELKTHLRRHRADALLIGEVWEDASHKIAYNVRRRYFVDGTLDSVMNYPFRTAILAFACGEDDGSRLRRTVLSILENYPQQVVHCNMNLLGTHDTMRILTALMGEWEGSREAMARRKFSPGEYRCAKERLLLASAVQYTLPGSPSLYYGDEAGMEGCRDPFNRRPYPWGNEDRELLAHFQALGQLRRERDALRTGALRFYRAEGGRLHYTRTLPGQAVQIYVNRSSEHWELPAGKVLLAHGLRENTLAPMGICIMEE